MAKRIRVPGKYQMWIDARNRFRLSDAQVQMARELGMNPKNLGQLANYDQEPWKGPLPDFIENLYFKRFGKRGPDQVRSIEQVIKAQELKKDEHRAAKKLKKRNSEPGQDARVMSGNKDYLR